MVSVYQQIVKDIIKGIEQHQFKRGEKLPSIRKLSQDYGCSKDTVQKAMLELKYQNRIYAVEKSGYYILDDQDFHDKTVELNPEDFQHLPYEDFRICLHESLIGREKYLFNYYHQQEGLEELIDSLQRLLMDYHVYCKKEQLVITAGSQQALYILSQLDFGPDKTDILIETPTYHRMAQLLHQQGLPYQEIERTLEGIDLIELETIFKTGRIRFFYTIPRMHNPLGSSYDLASKKKIVQLAQRYQVYIVEDDYMADFDVQKALPLHYLDTNERVIYIKSFTPTLFPALRIGGISLPTPLITAFLQYKGLIDYDTNLLMQKALSLYIDNGMFHRNTQDLLARHEAEKERLQQILIANPLPYLYQIQGNQLVFQMEKSEINPALKHNSVGFEMIDGGTKTYLLTTTSVDLPKRLQDLSKLISCTD